MLNWLVTQWQWPYAALFTGIFLLLIAPLCVDSHSWLILGVYVQLPIYMIHQWEEHRDDRFRLFVNELVGHGKEILTRPATFWLNALGVWGIDLVAIYLAWFVAGGFGLIATYLTLINGLLHVFQGVALRRYNPGLWTSLVLFLPLGGWSCYAIGIDMDWLWHGLGIGVAVVVHALIIVHVLRRRALLR
jgi:hypothetical protein